MIYLYKIGEELYIKRDMVKINVHSAASFCLVTSERKFSESCCNKRLYE